MNSFIRMARVAMTVFLVLILVLCVVILAYTFKLSKISVTDAKYSVTDVKYSVTDASGARIHPMYSVVDASGSRINTRRYYPQDDRRAHHTWRDNRVHGDQYHKYLW